MSFKAAFMFVAPGSDPRKHRSVIESPGVNLTVVGVPNYQIAAEIAKQLVEEGHGAVELCAGFGIAGVAAVKAAVKSKVPVGVVRFDNHPGLEFKSGDELF